MGVLTKRNRHFMPWALFVKPSGFPPQDPYTQNFFHIIMGLRFN